MKDIKIFIFSFTALLLAASPAFAAEKTEKWTQLFNGKDIKDWKVKIKGHDLGDNYGNTFRVEDGILKVSYDKYKKFDAKFGHLFYKKAFSNYRLRIEYRFIGDQVPGGAGWAAKRSAVKLKIKILMSFMLMSVYLN